MNGKVDIDRRKYVHGELYFALYALYFVYYFGILILETVLTGVSVSETLH